MFTHRTCWASPSFCRHQCLSASQWTASQRNCWGNSDRGGGGRGMHNIKIQLPKLVEDHCKVYLQTFRRQWESYSNLIYSLKTVLSFHTCSIGKVELSISEDTTMVFEDLIQSADLFLRFANTCRVALAWAGTGQGQEHEISGYQQYSPTCCVFVVCGCLNVWRQHCTKNSKTCTKHNHSRSWWCIQLWVSLHLCICGLLEASGGCMKAKEVTIPQKS